MGYGDRARNLSSNQLHSPIRMPHSPLLMLHLSASLKCRKPRIDRRVAQLLLDPDELVVLRDTVGPAGRTGLDLSGIGGHRDIRDCRVLGLARAVADDRGVAS